MAFQDYIVRKRSRRRLEREFSILQEEFGRLRARNDFANSPECEVVGKHLECARERITGKLIDVEGGWAALHAARRYCIFGLRVDELRVRQTILYAESRKLLPGWRKDALFELLAKDIAPAVVVFEAMGIFDDGSANRYHKIWLTADQMELLGGVVIWGLIMLIPLFWWEHHHWGDVDALGSHLEKWSFTLVAAIISFGLQGGVFSAAQSLFQGLTDAKVPDRVANHWMVLTRAVSGAVAGLAGYTFLLADLLKLKTLFGESLEARFAVAFVFGYAGEKLVSRVAGSVSRSEQGSS